VNFLLCLSFRGLSLFLSLSLRAFLVSLSFFLFLFETFSLSFLGQAGRGQRELPRAADGLLEVAADGEQEKDHHRTQDPWCC